MIDGEETYLKKRQVEVGSFHSYISEPFFLPLENDHSEASQASSSVFLLILPQADFLSFR